MTINSVLTPLLGNSLERWPTRITTYATWLYQAVNLVGMVLIAPLLLTHFGREGAGAWFFVLGSVTFFQLCDFGIGQSVARQVAYSNAPASDDDRVSGSTFLGIHGAQACHAVFLTARKLFVRIALAILVLAIVAERTFLFRGEMEGGLALSTTWYLVVLSAIGYFVARPYQAYLEGLCRQAPERLIAVAVTIVGNVALFCVVFFARQLWILGLVLAVCAWTQAWLTAKLARETVAPAVWQQVPEIDGLGRKLWRASWEQGVTSVAVYLTASINPLLIGWMVGAKYVSEYFIFWRVASVAQAALVAVTLPHLPYFIGLARANEHAELKRRLERLGIASLGIACAGYATFVIVGPMIAAAWLGAGIAVSYGLLASLSIWHVLGVLQTLCWLYLSAYGLQRIAHVIVIGAIMNIGLSLFTIPRWGAAGSAMSTALALLVTSNWYLAWRAWRLWKILAASGASPVSTSSAPGLLRAPVTTV